jgi:hypothetical protein
MSGLFQDYAIDKKYTMTCQNDSTLLDELLEQIPMQSFENLPEYIRIVINLPLQIEHQGYPDDVLYERIPARRVNGSHQLFQS